MPPTLKPPVTQQTLLFAPSLISPRPHTHALLPHTTQRTATFLPRPRRPYLFTQLLTLSDGSTVTTRTTSPIPVYKSVKDTRNTALWNPSNAKLANVEDDEAGRLQAFRRRFGRGWDVGGSGEGEVGDLGMGMGQSRGGGGGGDDGGVGDAGEASVDVADGTPRAQQQQKPQRNDETPTSTKAPNQTQSQWTPAAEDNLMDLISADFRSSSSSGRAAVRKDKGKGKGSGSKGN